MLRIFARQTLPYSAIPNCRIRQFDLALPDKAVKEESGEISNDHRNGYAGGGEVC
jgi:hypothetical protein